MSARSAPASVEAITHSLRDVLLSGLATEMKRASDGGPKRANPKKPYVAPSRATAPKADEAEIVQALPPVAAPSPPYETVDQVFAREKTTQQLKDEARQVLRVPSSAADPRTAACFPHVNPAVGLALSPSYNPDIKGLGLYALDGVKKGEVICLFTGMWGAESDIDCLYGLNDPCVSNYATSYNAHVIDHTTWTGKVRPGNGAYVAVNTSVERLMCIPHVQRGGPTGCRLVYDVRAGVCDVGALFNGPYRNAQATTVRARKKWTPHNCEMDHCVVTLPKGRVNPSDPPAKQADDSRPASYAAIVVTATEDIPAVTPDTQTMTELVLYYGYDPTVLVTAEEQEKNKYEYKAWDASRYMLNPVQINKKTKLPTPKEWDEMTTRGQVAQARLPVSWNVCGPRVRKVDVGCMPHEALLAYQPIGAGQQAYLRSMMAPLQSNPAPCNDQQPAAAAAGPSEAGPSDCEPLVVDQP